MTRPRLEQLLWSMTALALLSATFSWWTVTKSLDATTAPHLSRASGFAIPSDDSLSEAAVAISDFELFGTTMPAQPMMVAMAPMNLAPPKPVFTLRGIVGGPPWTAVVEGFPGQSGAVVVRPGDQVERFIIRSITRTGVTIRGMDTSWTLILRQ